MNDKENTTVRVDGYTRFCLTAITVLLTLLVIGLWADPVGTPSRAGAATGYRDNKAEKAVQEGRWGTSSAPNKLAAAQGETNGKLDTLIELFNSGKAKVRIVDGAPAERGGSNAPKSSSK
jgi:hypothetical protein